jgi:DNA-binding SARP family transcriptional activator
VKRGQTGAHEYSLRNKSNTVADLIESELRAGYSMERLFEAKVGDAVVDLGPRQQRLVLAVLALQANRLVPLEKLIDLLWPVSPTRTAAHAVRVCVSRLRSLLTGSGAELVTKGSAYVLRIEPTHIDAHRFQALVTQARTASDDTQVVALLDQALGLWRGPALVDVADADSRDRLCGGLAEMRLLAAEDRLEALLRLGRHQDVVGELTEWVAAHPARERFVGQLMLALYRGGQASKALQVGRRHREYLAGHLGLDPGEPLRQLELAILRNDSALNAPTAQPRPAVDAVVPAQLSLNWQHLGEHTPPATASATPPLAQLPAAISTFTGRARDLDPAGRPAAAWLTAEHPVLLAGLSARATEHPLDERVAGQLMLAL